MNTINQSKLEDGERTNKNNSYINTFTLDFKWNMCCIDWNRFLFHPLALFNYFCTCISTLGTFNYWIISLNELLIKNKSTVNVKIFVFSIVNLPFTLVKNSTAYKNFHCSKYNNIYVIHWNFAILFAIFF